MANFTKFQGDKMRHEAQKRDHFRTKIRPGLRLRNDEDSDNLMDITMKVKEKRERLLENKQKHEAYDDAMQTVTKSIIKDKSIKRFVV